MYCGSGRSRGRTQINVSGRGHISTQCRTKKYLLEIHRSARDVSTYEICVHVLQGRRRENAPCQNTIAESWREAFNLTFKPGQHVDCRTIRNVAIRPGDMFSIGRPSRIKQSRLREEDKRTLGVLAAPHRLLRSCDLVE